jgi:hypothetical protein
MTDKAKSNVDEFTKHALDWVDQNKIKNKAISAERKAAEQLKKIVASGTKELDLNDKEKLVVGFMDTQSEEIDPKALFKKDPDLFWELVFVAKGRVEAALGDKEAAKLSRTVTKNDFKVKKEKK